MRALYRLSESIAGFDFFCWLVVMKARGATEVVFDVKDPKTNKFTKEQVMRRFDSILWPGPALLGMRASFGSVGDMTAQAHQQLLLDHVAQGHSVPRLRSPLPPAKERYTVTLRNFERFPERNSDEDVWREFAGEIGAKVIPDYEDRAIHLHDRMALYAGAEMNFFVTNGPVMLGFLSEYPTAGFDVGMSPPKGVHYGGRYPFMLPQHHQIWERPTLELLRRWFREWKDGLV